MNFFFFFGGGGGWGLMTTNLGKCILKVIHLAGNCLSFQS